MQEYLPLIGSRNKWLLPSKNLKVNEIVLVIDPDIPRREWKLGLIEAVSPAEDGLVRVIDMKTGGRTVRRSITRLSP